MNKTIALLALALGLAAAADAQNRIFIGGTEALRLSSFSNLLCPPNGSSDSPIECTTLAPLTPFLASPASSTANGPFEHLLSQNTGAASEPKLAALGGNLFTSNDQAQQDFPAVPFPGTNQSGYLWLEPRP